MSCNHNAKSRFIDGFYCRDCQTFFKKNSPTYRRTELMSTLRMVLHNIDASSRQLGGPAMQDALDMRDKIKDSMVDFVSGEDYEDLIAEAEVIMARYGVNSCSADVVL